MKDLKKKRKEKKERAYRFSVWTLVFRPFNWIKRNQVDMITVSPFMKQLCKFNGMFHTIIDSSCREEGYKYIHTHIHIGKAISVY